MQEYFDYSGFEEISPEFIEKKKIRRLGLACGMGLLGLFAIMCFWSYGYFFLAVRLGIPFETAQNFASDPFVSQLFHIIVSPLMIVLPVFIATKAAGMRILADIPFKKWEKGYFLPSVMLGVGFCLFSSIATNYGSQIFYFFGIEFPSNSSNLPEGLFGIIAVTLSTAFFPAVLEELAMRGMILGLLRKKGDSFAVICSAFIFGIMHATAEQIVFAFFVGIILGYITVKTGSIWPAITVHFINNLISVIFSYLSDVDSLITSLLLIAIFTVAASLSILGLIMLQKRDENFLKMSDDDIVSPAKKIICFLTSPAMIAGLVSSLLIAFFMR